MSKLKNFLLPIRCLPTMYIGYSLGSGFPSPNTAPHTLLCHFLIFPDKQFYAVILLLDLAKEKFNPDC